LRDVDNNILASGNLVQFTSGNRVTAELTFHFKDTLFNRRRPFTPSAKTSGSFPTI
jgi:hypothetical protein